MEQAKRGRRQVELFNFSFLDILACVIGLLIFILTIVVISGGGSSSPRHAEQVAEAGHHLADARGAAVLAANRRIRAEAMLGQKASQVIDPVAAAATLNKQADSFDQESRELRDAAASLEQRRAKVQAALEGETNLAALAEKQIAAAQYQSADLERRAALADADAQKIRATKRPKTEVRFYVPRVRETDRRQVWAELSGGKLYFLHSDDYQRTRLDETSERYERVTSAKGILVASLVDNSTPVPDLLTTFPADQTVISIALRPDGFAAFRQLRDWAWEKEYSIYWTPHSASEPIILTKARHIFEQ